MAEIITVKLWQTDYDRGTYLMNKNNVRYECQEHITIHPNPDNDFLPTAEQLDENSGIYDAQAFQLGFPTGNLVTGRNIQVDLNGFTMQYSREFALQQRFGSLFQLGATPFGDQDGPVDFVKGNVFRGKVVGFTLRNGTLGLCSHHGVQGNDASNVLLENLTFQDCEVAAASHNDWRNVTVRNCRVRRNRHDIPVLASYSQSRFLLPFARQLLEHVDLPVDVRQEGAEKLLALEERQKHTQQQVLETGATTDPLFANPSGLLDGSSYGFLCHGVGPAVNALGGAADKKGVGRGLVLENVTVENIRSEPRRFLGVCTVPQNESESEPQTAVEKTYGAGVQHDCVGAVIDIARIWDPLTDLYQPNELADLQAWVAAHKEYLPTEVRDRITLSPGLIEWMRTPGTKLKEIFEREGLYCIDNGDSMFHVHKGVFGLRLDSVEDVWLRNIFVGNIRNEGPESKQLENMATEFHPQQLLDGYQGCIARGILMASCRNVTLDQVTVDCVHSEYGDAVGMEAWKTDLDTVDVPDEAKISRITAPHGQTWSLKGFSSSSSQSQTTSSEQSQNDIVKQREMRTGAIAPFSLCPYALCRTDRNPGKVTTLKMSSSRNLGRIHIQNNRYYNDGRVETHDSFV
jgi:hypothetical protein